MAATRWLIADLRRESRRVGAFAAQTAARRRALAAARKRFLTDVLGRPEIVVACFIAGMAFGARRPRERGHDDPWRAWRWLGTAALWGLRTQVPARSHARADAPPGAD